MPQSAESLWFSSVVVCWCYFNVCVCVCMCTHLMCSLFSQNKGTQYPSQHFKQDWRDPTRPHEQDSRSFWPQVWALWVSVPYMCGGWVFTPGFIQQWFVSVFFLSCPMRTQKSHDHLRTACEVRVSACVSVLGGKGLCSGMSHAGVRIPPQLSEDVKDWTFPDWPYWDSLHSDILSVIYLYNPMHFISYHHYFRCKLHPNMPISLPHSRWKTVCEKCSMSKFTIFIPADSANG